MLPDVCLLEIFDVYVYEADDDNEGDGIEAWHTLVHVCRKWRSVVFGSPRRLNLRLYCGVHTPVREILDIWPPLPIVLKAFGPETWDENNINAALEHSDRIYQLVIFDIPSSDTGKTFAALQQPFPALTFMRFVFDIETAPVIPDSFLGGSAPSLQKLALNRIPFPGLPKLLLSSTHLVDLDLQNVPHSGYISPEAMVTALSVLTRLERLHIGFRSPRSHPDRRTQHPPTTRALLPVLTKLDFNGVGEYLEDFVARIDAPLLDKLTINFSHQLIFDTPQLTQFINRTPKFETHDEARVVFSNRDVTVTVPQAFGGALRLGILCGQSDWQLSSVAQVCSLSFPPALILAVERLYIWNYRGLGLRWQDDVENSQWLELFHPFIAVKYLYLDSEFTLQIATALKELAGRMTEVLPALETIFLEEPLPSGPVQEAIGQFVSARQLSGHPIAVSRWKRR